ncbi:MAG: hypothetical protein ACTS3F_05670 [Phycisphaerales bacterium]
MSRANLTLHAVDPQRLAAGHWCHERDRTIDEGDIYAAYSADRIGMEGAVRRPFRFKNQFWVTTGIKGSSTDFIIEAYRLVPVEQFEGNALNYHEKTRDGEAARNDPMGFYHAIRVKHGGKDWVLCGPAVGFVPGQEAQPDLFGALERGGR